MSRWVVEDPASVRAWLGPWRDIGASNPGFALVLHIRSTDAPNRWGLLGAGAPPFLELAREEDGTPAPFQIGPQGLPLDTLRRGPN